MADSPLIWDINESIPIKLFIMDPNTGFGLIGQDGYISLIIQRSSDNLYWDGNNWIVTHTILTVSEVDAINSPGLYIFNLPAIANYQADIYSVHAKIDNPPLIQGDSYETHVSRLAAIRLYESEPI